jgi:hypothetical protein
VHSAANGGASTNGLMLTTHEIQQHLKRFTYRPGWSVQTYDGRYEGQHIVIWAEVPDTYNPGNTTVLDIHSRLPPIPDENYLWTWLHWRIDIIERHECREFFKVDGRILYDPHADGANQDRC